MDTLLFFCFLFLFLFSTTTNREQIENHDEKVEFDRLAKEKFDAKISKDKINMAQQLQKEAREKKEATAEAKRRSESVAENSKVVFGSSTGMIARLKKKKKKRKEEERKKKEYEEKLRWDKYKDVKTGKEWDKRTIQQVKDDPDNLLGGAAMERYIFFFFVF